MGQFSFIMIYLPGRSVFSPTGKPGLAGLHVINCIIKTKEEISGILIPNIFTSFSGKGFTIRF